ncbi:MAG: LytTR family DNA-binding domain-containing protein [Hydrogenoanaerobacterium sp.]
MHIAVVDNNTADRENLVSYIKKFSYEKNYEIKITVHSLGENFLEDDDLSTLDVVFLDIYMGIKSGMDVAKILRTEHQYDGIIVFCTTTSDYALEGYKVNAFNYILKPYTYKEIELTLDNIARLRNEKSLSIRIKDGREWRKIKLCDILYIEKQANYIHIHTTGETHTARMTFKEIEQILAPHSRFTKCDRGVIVNLFNVSELKDNIIIMQNGDKVPVSRRNIPFVNEQYLSFIFDEMEKE